MNFLALAALLFGAVFAIAKYLDHRRTQAVKVIARQLGLTHRDTPAQFIDDRISQSNLCSKGRNRTLKNVIKGRLNNRQVSIGDYAYVTGSGKNRTTHRQTIVVLECTRPYLPNFSLVPKNIFHKIGTLFGQPDITFDSHPQFSKRYRLTGSDERAIRDCFTSDVLTFFEEHKYFCVEGMGAVFLYYKRGYSLQPQVWQKLINTACRAYDQF